MHGETWEGNVLTMMNWKFTIFGAIICLRCCTLDYRIHQYISKLFIYLFIIFITIFLDTTDKFCQNLLGSQNFTGSLSVYLFSFSLIFLHLVSFCSCGIFYITRITSVIPCLLILLVPKKYKMERLTKIVIQWNSSLPISLSFWN